MSTETYKIQLRGYQTELKRLIYREIKQGHKAVLSVMPTGGGKTYTMGSLAADGLSKGRGILIVVHRDNLINQTYKSLKDLGFDRVGVVKPGWPPPSHKDRVVVASLQSLSRRKLPRLGAKVLLIIDECHTVAFYESMDRIRRHYAATSDIIELGFTATPYRAKKSEYMGQFYQAVARTATIRSLQEMNRGNDRVGLTPTVYKGWNGLKNFDQIHMVGGEFDHREVTRATLDNQWLDQCVDIALTETSDRKVAVFCASVKQAQIVSDKLTASGHPSAVITGDTPISDRRDIYQAFSSGGVKYLCGVGCFTEGWDCPICDCIAIMLPIGSLAKYAQVVGRGIRAYPGKLDCLVLDFCGNFDRHGSVEDISEKPIELFPEIPASTGMPTKECDQCGAEIPQTARICPECGYVFPTGVRQRKPKNPEGWGLKLTHELKHRVSKMRRKRFKLYRDHVDPQMIASDFADILESPYLYGSCFKLPHTPGDFLRFRDYLCSFTDNREFVEWHTGAEFGDGRKNPITGETIKFWYPHQEWWEILGVNPTDTLENIMQQYQVSLVNAHYDGDGDRLSLLGYAIDKYLSSRKASN